MVANRTDLKLKAGDLVYCINPYGENIFASAFSPPKHCPILTGYVETGKVEDRFLSQYGTLPCVRIIIEEYPYTLHADRKEFIPIQYIFTTKTAAEKEQFKMKLSGKDAVHG